MALLDHFVGYGGKVTNGVANVIETRGSCNFAGLCQRHTENLNTEGAEGHGGIYPPCSSLEKKRKCRATLGRTGEGARPHVDIARIHFDVVCGIGRPTIRE